MLLRWYRGCLMPLIRSLAAFVLVDTHLRSALEAVIVLACLYAVAIKRVSRLTSTSVSPPRHSPLDQTARSIALNKPQHTAAETPTPR